MLKNSWRGNLGTFLLPESEMYCSGAAGEDGCDGMKTGLEVKEVKTHMEMDYSSAEMDYSSVEMDYSFCLHPIIGPPSTLDGELEIMALSLYFQFHPIRSHKSYCQN